VQVSPVRSLRVVDLSATSVRMRCKKHLHLFVAPSPPSGFKAKAMQTLAFPLMLHPSGGAWTVSVKAKKARY
jgi:hypothetical protein